MGDRLLVVGIGNELRGDDGAGVAVARRLKQRAEVDILELQGEPTALLDAWSGYDAVILIDTMRSGAPPGTIRRIDASREPLPAGLGGSTSTHAMGLGETVELGRRLDRLPARVVLYAIEGRQFETGMGVSGEVGAVLEELVARVAGEVH